MKLSNRGLIPVIFGLLAMQSPRSEAVTPGSVPFMPNNHGKSITTPTAWGASNNVVFVGAGGTSPSPYYHSSDGAAVVGFGVGDPVKNLALTCTLISIDLTQWQEYSSAFHLYRDLGDGGAVGAGVENVMLTSGGDSGKSLYVVYSRGVQNEKYFNKNTNATKLHYSVGAGTGRFGEKSPEDIASGKGKNGTYVFGNISYEIADSFNLITYWNGLNLNAGVSKSFSIGTIPFSLSFGVADLTKNSGDGSRFVFAGGYGFKL